MKTTTLEAPNGVFQWIVMRPWRVVIASLLAIGLAVTWLPDLRKDTRADAFLDPENPALVYRDRVKEQFGLSDPLIIAVVNESEQGIFNPQSLALVQWLTDAIDVLPNINSARVRSLATEKNITGTAEGMEVEEFFDPFPDTQAQADAIRQAIADFPLYQGSLVARDGKATLIVADLLDEDLGEETYDEVMAIVERAPAYDNEIHVAGEGAVIGYLGRYIDSDASRLNPIAAIVITLIILLAFHRISPALLGNVVILAAVLMTLGIMAASGVAFFVITNALPVILIGIAVADAVHIYSHYFELKGRYPDRDQRTLVVQTMHAMWRPVTLTTLTTMMGFLGLFFAADMPPFRYFGLFTALGVLIAGVFSLVFLPAALVLTNPRASAQFGAQKETAPEAFTRFMVLLGKLSQRRPRATVLLFCLIGGAGLISLSRFEVDEDRIRNFHPDELIYQADSAINRHLDGTSMLDIVIETNEPEALFEPAHLRKIEALQRYAHTLPYVRGSTSVVDYLKQMNRALNGGHSEAYTLPLDRDLVAQYFLLYSASADPTDFEEEVDYDYQTAMVRLNLNSGSFQDTRGIVLAMQDYIDHEFNSDTIQASLSGRVNLNYHWLKDLGRSHFIGVAISLLLVWLVSAALFGSALAGIYTLLPVAGAILLVYAAMVAMGISLGIGTSMFASVAIGLGVDFAIHTLERLRVLYAEHDKNLDRALAVFFPTTGRALLFNFLAIACGFGVLISSKVVPLSYFGTIVVVAVSSSFLASLTLLPALLKLFQPGFLTGASRHPQGRLQPLLRISTIAVLVASLGYLLLPGPATAAELETAESIVARVNSVDDGEFVTRKLVMHLVDRRGKARTRETIGYRKYYGKEKRSLLNYTEPANVQDTAFLTWDYPEIEKDDDQWLYLPALRKVRRISASDRGDYFLGTDFTFEDMKLEGKLSPQDYEYHLIGEDVIDGIPTYHMGSAPRSDAIAKELGYGRTEFWVDTRNWLIIKADYWDPKGQPLKSMQASDIRQVQGIWTRHQLRMQNHVTGHETRFEFSEVDYQTPVTDQLFTQQNLARSR